MLKKYQNFRKTKQGAAVIGVIAIVFVIIFGSIAIDSGSIWHYALTMLFFFDALLCLVTIFSTQKATTNANKRRTKKTA